MAIFRCFDDPEDGPFLKVHVLRPRRTHRDTASLPSVESRSLNAIMRGLQRSRRNLGCWYPTMFELL